jgi:hypothetical protein
LTSLYPSEFEELLPYFSDRWRNFFKHYNFYNKRRSKPLTYKQLEKSTKTLSTNEERLFFVLYFFKNNNTQENLGFNFEMSQAHVSRWLKLLTPILHQAIKDLHLLPAQNIDELIQFFRNRQQNESEENQTKSLHIDVTERTVGRKTDWDAQKEDYSGKKSTHTAKNTVITDESQFVYFTGYEYPGSVHDKTMACEEVIDMAMFQKVDLWFSKDKGYQGYQPQGVHLLEPFKAKRNYPLEQWQKKFNHWISSIRITCEHAISGIKRCRVVKEKNRYYDSTFRNLVFNIAGGLQNLRGTLEQQGEILIKTRPYVCALELI